MTWQHSASGPPSTADSSSQEESAGRPQRSLDEWVQRDVVRALYGQTPQSLLIGLILGAVFVYVFYRRVGSTVVWWYAAMLLSQTWGLLALLDFRRRDRHPARADWPIASLLRMFMLRAWSAGLLLGAMAWLFFEPAFGDARWLTVLCICGLAAGSITSYAYHLPTLYGFMITLFAPMWLRLVQLHIEAVGQGYWVSHTVLLFYFVMLCWFGLAQHRMLVGSIRMRHENRQLLHETRVQKLALEKANDAKARFFAAASHDLRQPLQALGHYASLLKPHAFDAPHVDRIAQCVASLDGLLEGVLSISRLDAGKVEAHLQPLDLAVLLRRMCLLYEGAAQAKGLQLRLRLPKNEAPWTRSDPVLLERILGNLLSNALRYTAQGSVLISVRRRAAQWEIAVWDTGSGIAPEMQPQVFDEFVQLNNPQRDSSLGVGLGLATVKRICTLLAHPLRLASVAGRGSCFAIGVGMEAPIIASADPSSAELPLLQGSELQGRVLVVEDNEMVRESLLHTLRGWALDCHAVADAEQALNWLDHARPWPDVIISDWRLPGQRNGIELLATIRLRSPSHTSFAKPAPHFILMTGETQDSLGELPSDILLLKKPFRPLRLRAVLSAHLPRLH